MTYGRSCVRFPSLCWSMKSSVLNKYTFKRFITIIEAEIITYDRNSAPACFLNKRFTTFDCTFIGHTCTTVFKQEDPKYRF